MVAAGIGPTGEIVTTRDAIDEIRELAGALKRMVETERAENARLRIELTRERLRRATAQAERDRLMARRGER